MADIVPIADLTQTTLDGGGVFDVLMRSVKTHLEAEFQKDRIKGPEYATVYLGSLDAVMRTSLDFLLQRQKIALEAELMAQQVLIAQAEVLKANAQVQVALAEIEKVALELEIMELSKAKIPAEIAVLQATKCKLDAEFDLIKEQTIKVAQETLLLAQKVVTEAAQVSGLGVDADSVIGKQKALYGAQTAGFARDAEQKAAKLLADTWNVRRTTDEGTVADGTNMLNDATVGRAINKMLTGVGA